MREIHVIETRMLTILVNDEHETVRKFKNDEDLVDECINYNFGQAFLPIRSGALKLDENEHLEFKIV